MMIASSITGFGGASFNPFIAPEKPLVIAVEAKESRMRVEIGKGVEVEKYVRNYFSDIPVMVEIARCESRFRQYGENGEVLRGEQNSLDRGVMQINEYYHSTDSDKLGYDILTIEGNTAYGRHLFEKYGVRPWQSSVGCWGRTSAYSEYKELAVK